MGPEQPQTQSRARSETGSLEPSSGSRRRWERCGGAGVGGGLEPGLERTGEAARPRPGPRTQSRDIRTQPRRRWRWKLEPEVQAGPETEPDTRRKPSGPQGQEADLGPDRCWHRREAWSSQFLALRASGVCTPGWELRSQPPRASRKEGFGVRGACPRRRHCWPGDPAYLK